MRTCFPFENFECADLPAHRIPEPFLRQLSERQKRLTNWRTLLEVLCTPDEKATADKYVAKEFEAWLRQTGRNAELIGLKALKHSLLNTK